MKVSQPAPLLEWTPRQAFEATLVVISVFVGFWLLYVGRIALFGLFTAIVISTAIVACVYTLLVFALLEFGVEPRLYNRRRFSSLLVALLVIALWDAAGLFGLLAAPPLAAALQILFNHLVTPGTANVAQPIDERFAALEGRLATLDASLRSAPEGPSPQVASLVTRTSALLAAAKKVLSNQGALPRGG